MSGLEKFDVPFPEYFRELVEKLVGRKLTEDELAAKIFLLAGIGLKAEQKGINVW